MLTPATEAGATPTTAASAAPSAIEPTMPSWVAAAVAMVVTDGCLTGRGWSGPGLYVMVEDFLVWQPREDGRMTVRLSRFPFAGGCRNLGAPDSFSSPPGGFLVWEKTWPDDFRTAAAQLGWPDGIFERCPGPVPEQTLNECYVLAHELFYGSREAAEEARLASLDRMILATMPIGTAEQLFACKAALAEEPSLAVSPQVCDFEPQARARHFPALVSSAKDAWDRVCVGHHLIEPCADSDEDGERAR